MKDPTSCGMLGKQSLGDLNCQHQWNWSQEIITTAPLKQHRSCKLCGRRECVDVCRGEVPMDECRDPKCPTHGQPPAPEAKGLVLKNGILRYV